MARHLVTGAAGLIGYEVARALLARGDEVVAADIGLKGGLEDLETLAREHRGRLRVERTDLARGEVPRGPFDSVFHLAAIVGVRYVNEHPWDTLEVNLRSTLAVLERAMDPGCKTVVFGSSSENYASGVEAGQVPIPTPEDVTLSIGDIALPRWSYAASKIAGESAVFAAAGKAGFAPVVVRFHNVYGPRMGPTHVIPELLHRCRDRTDPFPVYGMDQTRSFLHVEDAARALLLVQEAASQAQSGIWNVGSPVETRIGDLVQLVLDTAGHRPRVEDRPPPPGSVSRRVPDVSRLYALGFRPRIGLAEGVRGCWDALARAPKARR